MSLGVSTACLYPLETEEAFRFLASKGVKNIEIFLNSFSETKDGFISDIKSIKDFYGVKIVAIHPFSSSLEPFFIFSDYPRRFDEIKKLYNKYFEIANYLGAKIVSLHGDKPLSKLSIEEYCERYLELFLQAKEYNVSFNQENVANFRSKDIEFISEMKSLLNENVSFTLDVKQSVRSGNSVIDVANAMGENISHIHISDNSLSSDCLLPLKGTFDFNQFFEYMKNNGYKGSYIIEVYNNCYENYDEIISSFNSLSKILWKILEKCIDNKHFVNYNWNSKKIHKEARLWKQSLL